MTRHSTDDLTAWDKVQLARHSRRPHTADYVHGLCERFVELHGDRCFGDDPAIIGGLARFDGRTVMVVGQWYPHSHKFHPNPPFDLSRNSGRHHTRMLGSRQAKWRGQPLPSRALPPKINVVYRIDQVKLDT